MNIKTFTLNMNDIKKQQKQFKIDNDKEIIEHLNNELNDIVILNLQATFILSLVRQGKIKLHTTMQGRVQQQCVVTGQDIFTKIDDEITLHYIQSFPGDEEKREEQQINLNIDEEMDIIYIYEPYNIELLHCLYESIMLSVDLYPRIAEFADEVESEKNKKSEKLSDNDNTYQPFKQLKNL